MKRLSKLLCLALALMLMLTAFAECSNLTDIYYQGTEAEWNEITVEESYDYGSTVKVHFEGE